MWRSCSNLLRQTVRFGSNNNKSSYRYCACFTFTGGNNNNNALLFSSFTGGGGGGGEEEKKDNNSREISLSEAKKLMRLVNVEALKMKLGTEGKEVIGYKELLDACQSIGVAKSLDEAATFARVLDDAGVVLLFRDQVYLHPHKVTTTTLFHSLLAYFLFRFLVIIIRCTCVILSSFLLHFEMYVCLC